MTTWKGRVEGALDPDVWEFLRADDAELLPYDCEASREHAERLHAAGLLTAEELDEVEGRLAEIAHDPDGYLESDEDVHSAIERLLGDVGRKIHAGRSRNDQVVAALGCTCSTRAPRRGRGSTRSRSSASPSPSPRPRRSCPATRISSARSR